jgi:hypothetical protein
MSPSSLGFSPGKILCSERLVAGQIATGGTDDGLGVKGAAVSFEQIAACRSKFILFEGGFAFELFKLFDRLVYRGCGGGW